MPVATSEVLPISRARIVFASVAVGMTVFCVWALIEYRTQPPPPPNPIAEDSVHP